MSELHWPWLELTVLLPLVGAVAVARFRDAELSRKTCTVFSGLTLACAFGAWRDFVSLRTFEAVDRWDIFSHVLGQKDWLVIDELSAPLLPLTALLYLLTSIATLRTKVRRFSFAWNLASEGILLALFSCKQPWGIIALTAATTIHPWLEIRSRGKPTRVFTLHMGVMVCLLVVGWSFVEAEGSQRLHSLWAIVPLLAAIFIRSGIVPVHCWMTDLFEHTTFGTALLYVTPIPGAYLAARLVLPIAPDWVLRSIGLISLITAVYAGGMALVQREGRRFFCYLFLSHSALVLVGLESVTRLGLTGSLCVWLSVGLTLGGFGLTLRSLEARRGRLLLTDFHGGYEQVPMLAILFLLTGLASVGFPGTFGFLGTELLIDGAVEAYPHVGITVVLAAALNGIAIVQAYFRLFTGARHVPSVALAMRLRERIAVLVLAVLILGGGLFPQPGVLSRHHAAVELLSERERELPDMGPPTRDRHGVAERDEWTGTATPERDEASSRNSPSDEA